MSVIDEEIRLEELGVNTCESGEFEPPHEEEVPFYDITEFFELWEK